MSHRPRSSTGRKTPAPNCVPLTGPKMSSNLRAGRGDPRGAGDYREPPLGRGGWKGAHTAPEASLEPGHRLHSGRGGRGPALTCPTSQGPHLSQAHFQWPSSQEQEGVPLTVPNPAPTSRKGVGRPARQGFSPVPVPLKGRPPSAPQTRGSTRHLGGPAGLNQESSTHTPRPKVEAIKSIFLERQLRQRESQAQGHTEDGQLSGPPGGTGLGGHTPQLHPRGKVSPQGRARGPRRPPSASHS